MMVAPDFDQYQWSQDHFANAPLGDKRRSKRLANLVEKIVNKPAASIPKINECWKDTKATYRLLDCPEATLQSVTAAHRERLAQREGVQLILSDTCHIDFGRGRKVRGAGPVGPGKSVGFLLHSALAYDAADHSILGVAGQIAHVRSGKNGKRRESEKGKQWAESNLWSELFQQVGPSSEQTQRIHVCDSAADDYENFFTAIENLGSDVIIRCGRVHRHVIDQNGEKRSISKTIQDAKVIGGYRLEIPRRGGRKARTAKLEISTKKVFMPQPRFCSEQVKASERNGLELTIVIAREIDPPRGAEPICWILLTSLPVSDLFAAMMVIQSYELRWQIEEWHKAIKTGCALESSQHQDIDRLLPLTGIYSVVAVLLLQLRESSRRMPHRPAEQVVPKRWIDMLMAIGSRSRRPHTAEQLWRAIAQLGGFLNRKGDGNPGWQTIWSGWRQLHMAMRGYDAMQDSA